MEKKNQIALIVQQARLPTLLVKLVLILARIVIQENTLQQAPDFAHIVRMESGQTQLQRLLARHAMPVLKTHFHLLGAQLQGTASANPARLGRMGAHARRVQQASTRSTGVTPTVQNVQPGSLRRQLGQHRIHAATVLQARSREQVPVHARIATTANTKTQQAKAHALAVGPESIQRMSMKRNPDALIAVLATNKALMDRIIATASVRRESTR